MIMRLVMSFGLVAFGSIACANVKVMSNSELDEVVIATQPQEQMQPTLPESNANGQIGAVAAGTFPTPVIGQTLPTHLPDPTPIVPTLSPAVAALLNQILNQASQTR